MRVRGYDSAPFCRRRPEAGAAGHRGTRLRVGRRPLVSRVRAETPPSPWQAAVREGRPRALVARPQRKSAGGLAARFRLV